MIADILRVEQKVTKRDLLIIYFAKSFGWSKEKSRLRLLGAKVCLFVLKFWRKSHVETLLNLCALKSNVKVAEAWDVFFQIADPTTRNLDQT